MIFGKEKNTLLKINDKNSVVNGYLITFIILGFLVVCQVQNLV
jgi:hypothetical protein